MSFLDVIESMAAVALLSFSARYGWESYGRFVKNWSEFLESRKRLQR